MGRHSKAEKPTRQQSKQPQPQSIQAQPQPAEHDPRNARRVLVAALAVAGIATLVALIALWPRGEAPSPGEGFLASQASASESVKGVVVKHSAGACGSPDAGRAFEGEPAAAQAYGVTTECQLSVIELKSGPDEGKRTLLEASGMPGETELVQGDKVLLAIHKPSEMQGMPNTYTFLDMDRTAIIWLWLGAAVLLIAVVGMARGVLSLVGLGLTLITVMAFLVPALLRGGTPVPLAITAGAVILFPVIFLVHGINWKAASALAGTLTTMVLASGLASLAISTSHLRGLGDDDNLLIQTYLPEVSVTGLMLAGFIIGALGVLNDVTIAQSSTVQELYEAAPKSRPMQVFRSAMRVGRDHIASMVYTLVLAYLGTALPLSILLSVSNRPLMQSLTSDVVATELLRSIIGAIALVLAVPITTFIAAHTVTPETAADKPQGADSRQA